MYFIHDIYIYIYTYLQRAIAEAGVNLAPPVPCNAAVCLLQRGYVSSDVFGIHPIQPIAHSEDLQRRQRVPVRVREGGEGLVRLYD